MWIDKDKEKKKDKKDKEKDDKDKKKDKDEKKDKKKKGDDKSEKAVSEKGFDGRSEATEQGELRGLEGPEPKRNCVHHQKDLVLYCESCEEPICDQCSTLGPHNNQVKIWRSWGILTMNSYIELTCKWAVFWLETGEFSEFHWNFWFSYLF